MNDELPELSPADTERVRRLLAEARHADPLPDDVAARLDRTLATLADERRELEARTVVTLASRRRRRATQVLVAAVAVVAVGIGVGQVVSGADLGGGSASDSGAADSREQADSMTAQEATPPQPGAASERSHAETALADLPQVDDASFDADVARVLRTSSTETYDRDESEDGTSARVVCDRGAWGPGQRVWVRYRGDRAALVFRPVVDGSQAVDLFACDADLALRSGSVLAP